MLKHKEPTKKSVTFEHIMSNKGLEPLHSVRKTDTLPVKLIANHKKIGKITNTIKKNEIHIAFY